MIVTTSLIMETLRALSAITFLGATVAYFVKKKRRIFVQIASYRDPECQYTVEDLFEKAKHPERIYVGICWQFDKEQDSECFKIPYKYPDQVRVYEVPAKESKGVCWARNITQSLWKGEEYTLMIDSHMRFDDFWDEKMIKELSKCNSKKAVLTCYPAGYIPPHKLQLGTKPTIQRPHFFDKTGNIRFKGDFLDREPEEPIKGLFIAAGFMFSKSDVIKEVPYDPYMYFSQEEISYVVRLYTHGWDVYHPSKVMIYHYYKKPDQKDIPLHWTDNKEWTKMKDLGTERFHYLVKHTETASPKALEEIEKYGLGTKRTLEEFEKESGVDFKKLEVSEYGLRAKFVKDLPLYKRKEIYIGELDDKRSEPEEKTPLKENDDVPAPTLPASNGKKIVMMFLPVDFSIYIDEFFKKLSSMKDFFQDNDSEKIYVIHGNEAKAHEIRNKYNLDTSFISDAKATIYQSFGRIGNSKTHPYTVILSPDRQILSTIDQRNASNHVGEILAALKRSGS